MRHLSLISTCLLLLWSCGGQRKAEPEKTAPVAKAQMVIIGSATHDFGRYADKEPKVWVFGLRNSGTAPMIIERVEVGCGCTDVSYTHTPTPPGKTAHVRMRYDGNGFTPGHWRKYCTVYSNATTQPVTLFIKGLYFPVQN